MSKQEIVIDSDAKTMQAFWLWFMPPPAAGYGISDALSKWISGLFPNLRHLPNIFKLIDDMFKAQKPVAPTGGSTLKPESGDVSKFAEYAKPIFGTLLTIAFMTFLLNLHVFVPRRKYDGGGHPDAVADALTAIYTFAHAIEAFTGIQISEGLLEGVNEAFTEAFELLLTNPITKFYALYYGLENADDDEIKDIANSQSISNDSMAYLALLAGLSNLATVAEIATGYAYQLDSNLRNVFRKLNDYADNGVDVYLKLWQWYFNRVVSEVTEWLTTVGQNAVFHTQRLREIGKRYSTTLAEIYALFLQAEQSYNKAVADGREAEADRYLLDMHRLYTQAKAVAELMMSEVNEVSGLYQQDVDALYKQLDAIIEKIPTAVERYAAALRNVAVAMYKVMNFYIQNYKQDMQEIIETIAKYRSPSPEETIRNFEFVESFTAPGENYRENDVVEVRP